MEPGKERQAPSLEVLLGSGPLVDVGPFSAHSHTQTPARLLQDKGTEICFQLHLNIYFVFSFLLNNLSTVDLQCCVNLRCPSK